MNAVDFPPPRRLGISIHLILIGILAGILSFAIWLASGEPVGLRFILYIIAAALAFAPLPVLIYRLWALLRAKYLLDRDSLTITWGLRSEHIPISDVEWVRGKNALRNRVLLPPFALPGSILGSRHNSDLGTVEFLASDHHSLLFLATRKQLFAISPSDPQAFLQNIQRAIEMGSLSPAEPRSEYPVFIINEAWNSGVVRFFWLAALFLNIGLMVWVTILIPAVTVIPLGFLPSGEAGEAVPALGLILLPIVSTFLTVLGWAAGLFFYRKPAQQSLALILWGSSLIASLLFLVAVLFIVTTPI